MLEIRSDLTTKVIDSINDMNKGLQASFGGGIFHQCFDEFDGSKDDALASAGHVREETMFNGIVFGTAGG